MTYSKRFDIYITYEDGRHWVADCNTLHESEIKANDLFKVNQFNLDFKQCWYEVIETLDEQRGDRELVYKTSIM